MSLLAIYNKGFVAKFKDCSLNSRNFYAKLNDIWQKLKHLLLKSRIFSLKGFGNSSFNGCQKIDEK